MSDKLLVEIDMYNGELGDAIPALIFLAHELNESGTIEITNPINWNERKSNAYQVKWRFSEDELHLPLDIEFVCQLNDELKQLKRRISKNENSAIASLQRCLESRLAEQRVELYSEPD